jgi:hypothetical protein
VTAFDDADALLFADENMAVPALWKAQGAGAGTACRVIRARPDLTVDAFSTALIRATETLLVRVAEIAAVAKGDTFTLGAEVLTVKAAQRDALKSVWEISL